MNLLTVDPPLDSQPYIKDLRLRSGEISMFITDHVWNEIGDSMLMTAVYRSGGQQTADHMVEVLKTGKSISGNAPRSYTYGGHRDWYSNRWVDPVTEIRVVGRDVRLEGAQKPEENYHFILVKMPDEKVFEFTLLHKDCTIRKGDQGDRRHRFVMLMRPESTQEERLDYFYDHLSAKVRTVPMLRAWKDVIWNELESHGKIKKLESFGRFIGWEVQISEDVIGAVLSRELAYGRLPLPIDLNE